MLKSAGACSCAGLLLMFAVGLAVLTILTVLTVLTILREWEKRSTKLAFTPTAGQHRTAIRSETDK